IKDYDGKCQRTHGHRWEVEVHLQCEELDKLNMLLDFSKVKKTMDKIIDEFLDHWHLNETLEEENVTAEFLAKWFFGMFINVFYSTYAGTTADLARIVIWESPNCCVEYDGAN
ncbi:hypothetical protein LCGC14_1631210, partial [marine sediment metagenome]